MQRKADSSSAHTGPRLRATASLGIRGNPRLSAATATSSRSQNNAFPCQLPHTRCPEGNRPLQRGGKNRAWQCHNRTTVLLGKRERINESKAARPSHGAGLDTAARAAAPEPQVSPAGHGKSLRAARTSFRPHLRSGNANRRGATAPRRRAVEPAFHREAQNAFSRSHRILGVGTDR